MELGALRPRAPALARHSGLRELLELFPEDGQSVVEVASERGDWREVLALHLQALQAPHQLLKCLGSWVLYGVQAQPEERGELYCNTASGLVGAGQWPRALQLISEYRQQCSEREFWSSKRMCSLMLSIQAGCGDWASTLQVFEEAQAYQVTTEDRAMAMLSLSKLGAWQRALEIMGDQLEEPIFLSGMRAWIAGHQWQNVCRLLEDMDDRSLSPCHMTCSTCR